MNTNQPKVICRQFTTAQLDTLVVGEIGYDTTVSKYVGRGADGKITYIESQATTELELPEGTDEAPYLEWNGSAWIAVSNPTILANGTATKLYLVWDNSTSTWKSKTLAELFTSLGITASVSELNKLAGTPAGLTSTEIGYLDGVTSPIQAQLASKTNFSDWGNPDGGYKFDGVDDYVTVPDNANLDFPATPFTTEVLVDIPASVSVVHTILSKGANGYAFGLETGYIYFSKQDIAIWYEIPITNYLGKKTHIVCGWDGTNAFAYINGVSVYNAVQSTNLIASNSSALIIGSDGVTYLYKDNIYLTRLYNRALTQAEVTKLYNNGRPDLAQLDYADLGASQTELITAQVDRDFSGANNWVQGTMNTFDTTGDLSITSTAYGQYCRLPIANFRAGKKYKLTVTASALSGNTFVLTDDSASLSIGTLTDGANSFTFTTTTAVDNLLVYAQGTGGITLDNFSLTQIGCVAEYLPKHAGFYSWIETQNGLHGTVTGGAIPLSNKIGDTRTAYLLTTSTTPTMTDVIKAGWAVQSITMTTAENLTDIDATQETSSVALLNNKTLNNGSFTWTVADHNIYPTADKDLIFTLTGNGGAGTHIYVNLKKIV